MSRLNPAKVMSTLPDRLGEIRLNIRTGQIHTEKFGVLHANQLSLLYLDLSSDGETWPKETTTDGIFQLARSNPFDPVAEYLNQNQTQPLPIDQWENLDQHLLGIDDSIARAFLPRFLIAAVARSLEPGCEMRQLPVLIGPQWRGKTELGRMLFGLEWMVEGISRLDKDALLKAHSSWVVELAELDGVTRKADQESLKAFISERRDTFRAPYDRATEAHLRKFVFWGTSNSPPFRDPTGSTRFVAIPINPERMLPVQWAKDHRDQIWARAVEQYNKGIDWRVCSKAMRLAIAERNDTFTEADPWSDRVLAMLKAREAGPHPVRLDEIFLRLEIPATHQNKQASNRVRTIAEASGWEYTRKRPSPGASPARGLWPVPPVPPQCQGGMAQEKAGSDNPPGEPFHLYQPLEKELGKKGVVGAPPPGPVLEPLPVAPGTDGTGGTAGKPWHAVALRLLREDPKKAPYTVALELERLGYHNIQGRQVAQLWGGC